MLNGKKAYNLYQKYLKDKIDIDCFCMPSTSPANARYSLDDLVSIYKSKKKINRKIKFCYIFLFIKNIYLLFSTMCTISAI